MGTKPRSWMCLALDRSAPRTALLGLLLVVSMVAAPVVAGHGTSRTDYMVAPGGLYACNDAGLGGASGSAGWGSGGCTLSAPEGATAATVTVTGALGHAATFGWTLVRSDGSSCGASGVATGSTTIALSSGCEDLVVRPSYAPLTAVGEIVVS